MCLITNKQPQIATEDIEVCKFLTVDRKAIFYDFQYELGELYETTIAESLAEYTPFTITENMYLNSNFDDWEEDIVDGKLIAYGKGFHSIKKDKINIYINEMENSVTFKAIIPKGATYIEDFENLIISNQIIITERL